MADTTPQEGATIHGEVVYPDGVPAEGAVVDAIDGDVVFSDVVDADGQFSIEVDPGTYIVQAFDEGSGATSDEHEVTVDAGEAAAVDLVIDDEAPPPTDVGFIEGVVTDESGEPVSGAYVQADGESFASDETEADGSFSLEVEPGLYLVQAFGETTDVSSGEHEVTVDAGESVSIDLVLDEDEDVPPPEYEVGVIEGTVTDESGDPVSGALVQADGEFIESVETDADGSYTLEVEPGTYEVSAFHEETDAFSEPVTIEVDADETVSHDIELVTFDDDIGDGDFGESDYVADISVEHVGGTAPDAMPTADSFDSADGQINIDLMDFSQETWVQELSDLGVDETTEFEIVVEFTDFEPRAVVAIAQDLDVSFDGSTMTVRAKPLGAQWISDNPTIDDWPEGDADQADESIDAMLNLLVLNLDFPEDGFEPADHPMTGLAIATDAQAFDLPRYIVGDDDEPDRLEITIAGPHLTVDGTENEGIYQAFLPDGLLDEWGVDSPDDLTAAYKGDQTDFEATERDGGILIEIDVSYSAGTVGISPTTAASQPTPTPPENGDGEPTPTPDESDNGETPTPDESDNGEPTPTPDESDSIPGPGILGTVLVILGLSVLLRYRRRDRPR